MIKDHNNLIDHEIKQGDSEPIIFEYTDENNQPYDLSNAEIICQIRTTKGEVIAEPAVTGTAEGDIIIDLGATDDWQIGTFEWDLRITYPGGESHSLPRSGVSLFKVGRSVSKKG